MNREESIAHYEKIAEKAAASIPFPPFFQWNPWAESLLSRREEIEQAGKWDEESSLEFSEFPKGFNGDFSNFIFPGKVRFAGMKIPEEIKFSKAKFLDDVVFESVDFTKCVNFSEAIFKGNVVFKNVRFHEDADFSKANFEPSKIGSPGFSQIKFFGSVKFIETNIRSIGFFKDIEFLGEASFSDFYMPTFPGFIIEPVDIFFRDNVSFKNIRFDALHNFRRVDFGKNVGFSECRFGMGLNFEGMVFRQNVSFDGSVFEPKASFKNATFEKDVSFKGINAQEADFFGTTFENIAFFDEAVFRTADFCGMMANRAFSMGGAEFETVPNFIQASFKEPPRLDNMDVLPLLSKAEQKKRRAAKDAKNAERRASGKHPAPSAPLAVEKQISVTPDYDDEAKYRALRRVAIVAHDHEREMDFFAGEIFARRKKPGWQKDMMMWLSYPYQGLSNFGRSMALPLLWFVCVKLWFALVYALYGTGAVSSALLLSFKRMLFSFDRSGKTEEIYKTLYGVPVPPDAVVYAEILQSLFSAILIFLFILSVRNHFRIR